MDETAIAFEPPHARASATACRAAARPHLGARLRPRTSRSAPSARSAASPSASASTSCSRSSHHAAAARRRRRPGDLLRHDHRGDRGASWRPSGSTCSRRWPSGSRRAASPIRARVRVFVRIEKLDRIPGALGVEIVRSRLPEAAPRLRPVGRPRRRRAAVPAAWCVYLAPGAARRRRPRPGATRSRPGRAAGGRASARDAAGRGRDRGAAAHRASRHRAGGLGASPTRDPRFDVAATRTELDWALKAGRLLGLGAVAHAGRRPRRPACRTPATRRRSPPGSPARSAPTRSSSSARRMPPAGWPSRRRRPPRRDMLADLGMRRSA